MLFPASWPLYHSGSPLLRTAGVRACRYTAVIDGIYITLFSQFSKAVSIELHLSTHRFLISMLVKDQSIMYAPTCFLSHAHFH